MHIAHDFILSVYPVVMPITHAYILNYWRVEMQTALDFILKD